MQPRKQPSIVLEGNLRDDQSFNVPNAMRLSQEILLARRTNLNLKQKGHKVNFKKIWDGCISS